MKLRYIANACFLITLADGKTILTDPWFTGPCQQTWWNFPPVPEALKAEVWALKPDLIYISHLHHDHLHPRTLAPFDKAIPVLIGKMNTPNLRNGVAACGFKQIHEIPFETRAPLPGLACEGVLFADFHGNTLGDESAVEYDLDTSLYLFDADGSTLFLAVDNTILPPDAARIAAEHGAPDIAQIPYASASLYPMAMAAYSDARKAEARDALRLRTSGNFRELARALGAKKVIPAGGEYVLGGPAAPLSAFLPQPLESQLRDQLASIGLGETLAKLYPGDELDGATLAVTEDPRATHRGFTDVDRAAFAMTLAGEAPSFTELNIPDGESFPWARAFKTCAANYAARREKMDLALPVDVYFQAEGAPTYRIALDSREAGFADPSAAPRQHLIYSLDARLLICLMTGILSWNAMEASALIAITREPDVYTHDIHRSIVHFNLLG